MANDLLGLLGSALGTTPPSYMEGLLGAQQTEDLRKRSIGTGLANALIGYAAMPKNQNLGLGRILAGAAQAGVQGAQGVYDTATQDYMMQQKINEAKRQQERQVAQQAAIQQAAAQYPQYADAIRANPELLKDIVAAKLKPADSPFAKIDVKDYTPESVALYKQTGDITQLRAIPKEGSSTPLQKLQEYRANIAKANPNDPRLREIDNAIVKETQFAPANSVTVNMPSESERTAGFLTSRIQNSLKQLNQVVTKNPNAAAPKIGAEAVKFITGSDYLKNLTNPADRQQIENAQLEILDAALTLGTGAAYTREQLQNYSKSYFPQLGDKPASIKDKQDRLTALLRSANIKSGRAAPADVGLPPNVVVERVK